MRTSLRFVLLVVATAALAQGCGSSPTTAEPPASSAPLPHQMKGYELYSWQSGGTWSYVLMSGTDRIKTGDEVMNGPDSTSAGGVVKVSAQDVNGLESQLRRLPGDESVVWIGSQTRARWQMPADPLHLPPAAIVDAVAAYCRQIGVNLQVMP